MSKYRLCDVRDWRTNTSINAIKFGKITSEFEGKFCEGCENSENSGKTTEPHHGMGFVSDATHL